MGEVLKITAMDVDDQKLTIKNPKSGKSREVVFIPKKLADRLKDYLKSRGTAGDERIFPITYTAARVLVKKAGSLVGVHLRPHDLRRHAATYASRSGVPVEIVSKVILEACQPLHHPKISRQGQRCGGGEVGREPIWLMVGNEGEVVIDLAHLKSVDIDWIGRIFSGVISF